jgi:hypothetical protein
MVVAARLAAWRAHFARLSGNPYGWHMPMAKTPGPRNRAVIRWEPDLESSARRCRYDQALYS